MNSIKCRNCGLNNFSTESECRRCKQTFIQAAGRSNTGSKRGIPIYPLIFLAIVGGAGYYFYSGVDQNVQQINANEANRLAEQKNDPTTGLSRTQYDKHRSGQYGNAIKSNPSFEAQRKQAEETQKAMQAVSNSQTR